MVITSLDNDKVKKYRKLSQKKYRDEYQEYIVEGMHLVLEAYKSGVLEEVLLEEDVSLPFSVPYVYLSSAVMASISLLPSPPNIMGICKKKQDNKIIGNKILLLDEIQDPGNLGTIIRSAVAFQIDTIILSPKTVDLYNPKVLRATQGMIFHTNIITMDSTLAITYCKQNDYVVYGTNVLYGVDVRSLSSSDKKKFLLIVGNEGNGVSDKLLEMCDKNLYISMNSSVESLNVGVACSILLYELGGYHE